MKPPLHANPLWEATRDMHHACEAHAVGAAMASGNPPRAWYAAWLKALHQIHTVVDASLAEPLRRVDLLAEDLQACAEPVAPLRAAEVYAGQLVSPSALAGAGYVLTGAHLMGGEIMRRRLQGFPTAHLTWADRAQALGLLHALRAQEGIAPDARACFSALLAVMDEIEATWPQPVEGA